VPCHVRSSGHSLLVDDDQGAFAPRVEQISYSNERRQVASTECLQVMRDGVASYSLIGLPSFGDTFWHYYIICMGLGFDAPQATGGSIFVIQGKALCEQCALPLAESGSIHVVSFDIDKSGFAPYLDRGLMFNELRWLNYCYCNGIGISAVSNSFLGGNIVNIGCYNWCEMSDVGDPFCSGICACLCIVKLFSEHCWLASCFGECIGIGAVGNTILGREDITICCHNRYVMIDVSDTFCFSIRVHTCIIDQSSFPPALGFPICVAATKDCR